MCLAIALLRSDIPEALFEREGLASRVCVRPGGGGPEVRFDWRDRHAVIPVIDGGQLRIVHWGSRDRSGPLPATGWTWRETVESGSWSWAAPEPVLIPAAYGFEKGIWYKITEGIHGLLVRDAAEELRAYMICEPSTRYYRVMTRSTRMPWLMGEVI